jgi:hypothetical protein
LLSSIHSARYYLVSVRVQGENPDIFQYQIVQVPNWPMTLIRMLFYQCVEVLAISAPELEEVAA